MHTNAKSAFNSFIAISATGLVLTACSGDNPSRSTGTGGATGAGATGGTTPGAAGSGTGAGDGTGGGGGMPSTQPDVGLCEGIGVVLDPGLPGDEVVDDFEGGSHGFNTIFIADPSEDELAEDPSLTKPAHTDELVEDTERAGKVFHISTEPLVYWGGGMLNYFGCRDVSAFTGLSFYAKGSTATGKVSVATEYKENEKGSCEGAECGAIPSKQITLTEAWQPYKIPFEAFRSSAPTLDYYGSITGIRFNFPPGGEVDFYLDDLEYYVE